MKNKIKQLASLALVFLVLGGCTGIVRETADETFTQAQKTLSETASRRETESATFADDARKTTSSQSEKATENTASGSVLSTKKEPSTAGNTTAQKTSTQKAVTTRKATTTQRPTTTKHPTTKLPTATQPSTAKTTTATVPVEKNESVIIGLRKIDFGCGRQGITDVLGNPSETVTESLKSGGTVKSLVYAGDYEDFVVCQLLDGEFFAIYTVDESIIITDGDSSYSLRAGGDTEFSGVKISVCKDSKNGGKAYAMKAICGSFSYYPHELSSLAGQEKLIFHTTNAVRAVNGLYAFEYSEKASDCVRKHCEDMSARNYFSHDTPEGVSCPQRLRNEGIEYTCCGENLAAGYNDAFALVDGWYNSAGHRKNLLDNRFRYLGMCVVEGNESYRIYAGQNFYA